MVDYKVLILDGLVLINPYEKMHRSKVPKDFAFSESKVRMTFGSTVDESTLDRSSLHTLQRHLSFFLIPLLSRPARPGHSMHEFGKACTLVDWKAMESMDWFAELLRMFAPIQLPIGKVI